MAVVRCTRKHLKQSLDQTESQCSSSRQTGLVMRGEVEKMAIEIYRLGILPKVSASEISYRHSKDF